ncbi:MAG: CooT family nickel-binding protein [Methanothrix sp.]|jgi:predicted RNA-binding protein|nr:CooT family nickel-binding protein [Methanothrix sp.]OPX79705.1 MAG: putative RNA-binding protein [Methanosaeta sp. PtaB.Bin087]OPY50001.1 MAG: putative RNA-binding protein [Methanosaeta sp. PtaU1.Bin055]NLX38376.1 CooT family nickel-binding protein [Methanothrix sp.]HNR57931.1 CooT family nickel-binding protein [Methanothrix sp.]
MCELSVYMKGEKDSLMEGVVVLVTRGDKVLMEDILGRTKEAKGRIFEVNITSQKAFLEPA